MQHKRSRLSTKILAFVLILALVFPASAFASVADVAKDTRSPGKSLANTYPAYTDIDWQHLPGGGRHRHRHPAHQPDGE